MAVEKPVCDVLCEAMEYLSKLGTNLRTRSESLKEKRINNKRLRNAHAVHKAAQKVLLICELSKKSLENVETGVRKVLSIIDASQAHTNNGGKNIDKKKQETDDRFFYFEHDSCKLRISKKVPVKHFMSVKVLAKGMPASVQDKYPVYYDCKLKRLRKKRSQKQCEVEPEINSNRRESTCSSNTNHSVSKSNDQKDSNEDVESDASGSDKSIKNRKSMKKSTVIKKPKTMEHTALNEGTGNVTPTESTENQDDDNSQSDKNENEQLTKNEKSVKLVFSQNKTKPASTQGKEDSAVSELIECFANVAKVNDNKTTRPSDKEGEKEANSVRKKFSKIKIVDDSSDSDISSKNNPQDSTQIEILSDREDNEENLETAAEPVSKRRKLGETVSDSKSKGDTDHNSKTKEDSDHNTETNKSDIDQKGEKDSKPLIRCVNITKLLKPDIIDTKINDPLNGKQRTKSKPQLAKKMEICDSKTNNKQKELRKYTNVRKVSTNDKNADIDAEFWAQKRKEVKLFKPKQFTININRLPSFTTNFLLAHKLQKIIQGCKTICEVSNVNNKEIEQLVNNINEVKNALLNESGSEDAESVTAEANNVKKTLLNDSDSELKDETSQNNKKRNQINCEKLTDPAAIKDALLNESDSDNNGDTVVIKNTSSDSITNETGLEKDAEKIKSSLLDDSESDGNQSGNNKTNPTSENTADCEVTSQNSDKASNKHSNTNEPGESTQDPEIIKSSLLNDSSDSHSDSPMTKRKKRKLSKHQKKHAIKSMQAKKMLLNHSSSSEDEEHSQELDKDKKRAHKQCRRKSRISSSSSSGVEKKRKKLEENSDKKAKTVSSQEDNSSGKGDGGTIDEHSDSSVSKMVRSKAKPSGSSGQNSDNQDASDKDIDGLTNLNSLNKPNRRREPSNNTGSQSSAKKNNKSNSTPVLGEDLLQAASISEASEDDNVGDEDLPAVTIPGLNGDSISHLAKDDLLGDSDSSVSPDKEHSEQEETHNNDDSEEENVKLKRQRKANAISSDSEGGTSHHKKNDEDIRVSDFEDSEDESSESVKRSKRKKKGSESDGSVDSSNEGGKKKRRRIKQVKDSDASGSDTENEGRNKHGRKNIRKVMGKNQLEEATKKAAREEKERMARITERQKLYNNLDFDESGKPDEVVLEKVVLDFDPETKEPLIEVDRGLVKKLKPHQANGIKFMWDACFESVKRIKKDKGSGCILAHCMGLGKTLQVISLTHTLLIHGTLTGVNRVLVVCPLSTVLNWVNEFRMWLKHAHSEFEVDIYELSRYKQNSERAFQLQQWFVGGGVCVLGYEMFRNLSADNNRKFKKKMLKNFQESLVDPGPDLVVCDEGHLLKNEKTSLSQSMNRVKTRRRIVLTGTPLQNNLKEYYCMVTFVKPNLLGKYNEYLNRFVNPITNGQYTDSTEHDIKIMKRRSHVLHKMLDGAVQRRDYGVLAPFLPPKHEYVLFITLSDVQVKLYQHYLDNYSRRPLPGKSSGFLFPDFQSLQRIWTHPLVLKYNSERYEIMQQKKREREEEESEGSLVDFIDDDSTPEETSTEESSDDLSDVSDDSRKKSKKKKSSKKSKAKESKAGTRRGTRANPGSVEVDEEDPDIAEVVEVRNENPTEWWIKLVDDAELDDMRNSHKLVLLFDILRQCEAIGDKLLVFSQSLYSLDLIEHFLGKVDEATQEGRIDEKLGGHVGSWSPGVDYFRLDGSTSCENRSIWCKNFNKEDNPRARLFLISTRAGGLGINLVAANRVVIFDVSWNPSHDVQSIFRVYRFGQKKPCYVYRFLAMGTMEEKIYERQVTKQAISKRVIDEQQIDRHYAENDLAELYKFEARPAEPRPLPTLPKDRLFAEMLKEHEAQIYKYHEHDSLLENKEEETLSEEERKAAWEDFENEKNKPPPAPFPSAWPMHNGMVPGLLAQQQQQLAYAALAAMLRKDMPNINDNQIRDMLPLIYNSNPGLMQKMSEIYKYTQPGMMNSGMMNPGVMNPAAGGMGGTSGLQYEPPWQRQQQQQQQMRLQQLMQQNQMGAKFYAGGLGSRDPVAMALQQQRAREIMMGGAGRPRGRPPLAPRAAPTPSQDVVNLDSD